MDEEDHAEQQAVWQTEQTDVIAALECTCQLCGQSSADEDTHCFSQSNSVEHHTTY